MITLFLMPIAAHNGVIEIDDAMRFPRPKRTRNATDARARLMKCVFGNAGKQRFERNSDFPIALFVICGASPRLHI